jgi:hypothetical protein
MSNLVVESESVCVFPNTVWLQFTVVLFTCFPLLRFNIFSSFSLHGIFFTGVRVPTIRMKFVLFYFQSTKYYLGRTKSTMGLTLKQQNEVLNLAISF